MGFTKAHMKGVFIVENMLAFSAAACGFLAFNMQGQSRLEMLLLAVLLALMCCAVLLASALSLMFCKWFDDEGRVSASSAPLRPKVDLDKVGPSPTGKIEHV